MQAIVQLALESPLKLGVLQVPRMELKQISVHWDGAMFQLNGDFDAVTFLFRFECEQRMLVQTKLLAHHFER